MFKIHKSLLVLKNIQSGKLIYKYPFDNLVLINSQLEFSSLNFPYLKTLFLFENSKNSTLNNPSLKIFIGSNSLSNNPNPKFNSPNVKFFSLEESEHLKQIFSFGCFDPVKNLSKYSTNKSVQDQIDYYNQWLK
jgi:hypothetical protein